ncbi:MAG: ABC transporter substrate-binding protein [Peptostreptococcaceae bacterium]|nr:ABC transporter substrate-binding protein [Peptostreptococcaceae bacterium]
MMNLKKWLATLVSITVLIGALASCSTYNIFEQTYLSNDSETKIIIGVFEAQTGEYSVQGNDEIKGIELANSIYGNVLGKDVELIVLDNQSNIYTSESAIEGLIKLDPVAIIGSAGEVCSLTASKKILKAEIPTITPSCINPLITVDNDYYFRVSVLESMMGESLAEYAVERLKVKNVGIIKIHNDDSHVSVIRNFKDKVDSYDSDSHALVLNTSISIDEIDFTDLLDKVKESKAKAIFMPVAVNKADLIFTQFEENEMTDITFIGTSDWNNQEFFDMMIKHPEIKVAFPSDAVVNEDNEIDANTSSEASKFLLEYQLKYGEDAVPSDNVALGYDAYLLIMNAINTAGTTDRDEIRDALADTYNLKCVTGTFRFSNDGNPVRTINIATIVNGKSVLDYRANDDSITINKEQVIQTIESPEDLKAVEVEPVVEEETDKE